MRKSEVERLAVVEQKVDHIKETVDLIMVKFDKNYDRQTEAYKNIDANTHRLTEVERTCKMFLDTLRNNKKMANAKLIAIITAIAGIVGIIVNRILESVL